ncbi:hypothetical protein VIN01S_06850 [Vibrio inusitatus NBRC 102082]|uniref:Beta-lactamase-related domain-containing protein n=1 Tax=Vibrio inusitatus NBRC 102082 TaxID=1219070 RepID=A0A4Y3HSG4_9VIBR|nr:serine hydrolase domain-containing protein [Vibrio inusitatus]GEA49881.1 hypothetical protein VIN01S_06850 [Vibrio inusitatus NBRC 102082]
MKKSIIAMSLLSVLSMSVFADAPNYSPTEIHEMKASFDMETWQLGKDVDATRYIYTHASEYFKHADIKKGGNTHVLPTNIQPELGLIEAETHAGKKSLDQWTEGHLDAVIVIHKGNVVYEKYPRMEEDDKHIWWSVSKSAVGTLVGILEAEGKVDITKNIETYLPELKGSGWEGITVSSILEMASGMNGLEADDPEAYTNMHSPYALYESSLGFTGKTEQTMDSTYDYMKTLVKQKPANTKHEYTSVNTFVLAWLVEKMEDKPYNKVFEDRIWKHMGAEFNGQVQVSDIGAPGASGAISSTLRDLGRYGMMFTPSAPSKAIPESHIKKVSQGGNTTAYEAGMLFPVMNNYVLGNAHSSAYQWDIVTTDGDFAKAGYHGQTLYVSPEADLVVAGYATVEGYDTWMYARAIAEKFKAETQATSK